MIRIDSTNGDQRIVSSGGNFIDPHGIAVDDCTESIFVVDPNAFGGQGAVIQVDSVTGARTVISSGGIFEDPTA